MIKIIINCPKNICPTITADYGHVSKYHILKKGRYSLPGVVEILYE